MDVCIIGGGPGEIHQHQEVYIEQACKQMSCLAAGGLAAALGLQAAAPGIRLCVFDQAPAFKLCGAGLAINANGIAALKAMNEAAHQELHETGRGSGQNRSMMMVDNEGLSCTPFCSRPGKILLPEPAIYDLTGLDLLMSIVSGKHADFPFPGGPQTPLLYTGWFELQQLLYRHVDPANVQLGKRFKSMQKTGMLWTILSVHGRSQFLGCQHSASTLGILSFRKWGRGDI